MASKRQKRKKQNAQIRRKERRQKSLKILKAIDLWNTIKDTTVADKFLDAHYPAPTIELSIEVQKSVHAGKLRQSAKKILKDCRFSAPILGETFPVVDFFTTVKPILDVLGNANSPNAYIAEQLLRARERTAKLRQEETAATAVMRLIYDIDELLIKFGRIDTLLYFVAESHGWNEFRKWYENLLIECLPADRKTVEYDGKRRPAYRCGQPCGYGGIEWIEWDGSAIGLDAGQRVPVFVQSHALDNLYAKEARALFIEDGEWLVHDYLWQSLRKPTIKPMVPETDKFLVEYWLNVHKLGYLVASLIDGNVVVHSFLFLTMNGTPEGDRLWQELQLRKPDKQHLEIDKIETFLHTDIQHDVELRSILEECDCGHLFNILKAPPPPDRCVPGYAEDMRRFLRLE